MTRVAAPLVLMGAATSAGAVGAGGDEVAVSADAAAYAARQIPDDEFRRSQLAKAMTLMEQTERGGPIARLMYERDITLVVAGQQPGFAAQYKPPFVSGNIGESVKALVGRGEWPHRIEIAPDQFSNVRWLATIVAHEGAHFDLTTQHLKDTPIRLGAGLFGALGTMLTLPTLGMLDINGNVHSPGMGTIASIIEGSTMVTGMTHENYAYRVGDDVARELGIHYDSFVYREDGTELGALEGGWNIASEYMQQTGSNIAGKDLPTPSPVKTSLTLAGLAALNVGLWVGMRKGLHWSGNRALLGLLLPGALAAGYAGWQMTQRGQASNLFDAAVGANLTGVHGHAARHMQTT